MIPAAQMDLLRFLGESVYGDGVSYFQHLDTDRQNGIIDELEKCHFGGWGYRQLQAVLDPEQQQKLQLLYQLGTASALKYEAFNNEVYAIFEAAQIRFAPIKGADWAFNFYPAPGLRSFVDLDVLIHPEDCERALEVLKAHGFTTGNEELYKNRRHHHFAAYRKKGLFLEPHWTLPRFKKVDALALWSEIKPAAGKVFQYRLSPELSLHLIMRHAIGNKFDYTAVSLAKLLMDAAMIINSGQVDWAHLRDLSKEWELPYPGNILGAFPEFFPPEVIKKFQANNDNVKLFRQIFETMVICNEVSEADQVMAGKIWSWQWWQKRFGRFLPSRMRSKYNLPPRGKNALLIKYYLLDFSRKVGQFAAIIFRRSRPMQDYLALIERSERSYEQD